MPQLTFPQEKPAIRAAAQRALAARETIVAASPEWETWRRQAQAIKRQVMDRLEEYVQELTAQVRGWGGEVLAAATAAHANEIIMALARRHHCRLLVKSKSMTSEEIGLTQSLTAAGFQVLETDLGEFIIQLAGDTPAHLTAPAMHLNRRDIAGVFRERLGVSCETDPAVLSRQGAAYLRPQFWQAQMGITGVNFAAAASGHLVMLENEGNLRLSASVPPVQVALMGLEKIIPSLEDLEVFLRLLPTSATGQRLTALVHYIGSVKPLPQGRQAFYLILLDNGRRRLAGDPLLREALHCLRCGACLNICPIFQVGGGHLYGTVYPGAIGILLSAFLGERTDLTELCCQCGACAQICPVAIDLPTHIVRLRNRSRSSVLMRQAVRAVGTLFATPRLYRLTATAGRQLWGHLPAPLTNRIWGPYRHWPAAPRRSFAEQRRTDPNR